MIRFQDHYFPAGLRWTVLIILGGWSIYLLFWTKTYWAIAVFVPIIVLLFTTKYVIEIDTESRVIRDLFYTFFIRIGNHIRYKSLDFIRIDKERVVYNAGSRSRDRVADFANYTGTLCYDGNKSLELTTKSDYKIFGPEMKRIAEELSVPIERTF